jgi:hypothetical protein
MLILTPNVQEYFRGALMAALKKTSCQVTESTQAYIVYLLSEFTRAEKVWAGVNRGEQPIFALLMSRAHDADPDEALKTFKHVGDTTLYGLGFFYESLANQAVSPRYYQSIGENAYASAAHLTSAPIFGELSDRFGDLVNILQLISIHGERTQEKEPSAAQLLDWFERYKRTKSPELLDLLLKHGVSV